MKKAIAYYRVSTSRQGQSGLGLVAQKSSVQVYANLNKFEIIQEFKEIESTRKNKRPKLHRAIEECKNQEAILLIAKLDRLHRNVVFISKLMESDISFIAVDNPNANKFFLHILAAFAEYEREQISKRTKEALAAAKLRGVKLGKYSKVLSKKNRATSLKFALRMKPIIDDIQNESPKSIRKLAQALNSKKIKTFKGNGSKWHASSVFRLLKTLRQDKG